MPGLRTLARNVYIPSGRLGQAIETQSRVVSLADQDPNVWDDYRVLAVMLAQTGRFPEALQAAQTGLTKAPKDKQPEMQSLIAQLQQQLGVGPTLTNTLPAPNPTPSP